MHRLFHLLCREGSRPWGARCSLLTVALAVSGCSFAMNVAPSEPSQRTRQAARDCTSTIWYPLGDTVGASIGILNIGIATSAEDKVAIYGAEMDKSAGLALGVAQLAVYGGAAIYGYVQAGRCSELRVERNIDGDLPARATPVVRGGIVKHAPDPENGPDPFGGAGDDIPSWSAFRRHPINGTEVPSRPGRFGEPP